jgi:two-component system, NtrC family, sensor kinase
MLNVLFLEDEPADFFLVQHELHKLEIPLHFQQATSREEFMRALTQNKPDLILSDNGIPAFDGLAALRLVRSAIPETPFILVSGYMTEQKLREAFQEGAWDYVPKNDLGKLIPVIRRAISSRLQEETEGPVRRSHLERDTEIEALKEEIRELKARLRLEEEHVPPVTTSSSGLVAMCCVCKRVRESEGAWQTVEQFIRELTDVQFTHGYCPDCASVAMKSLTGR